MSFANYAEAGVMQLIFQAQAWANMADNAATSPFTNIYLSLHTADPGEAGSQTTSEIAYTSYARAAVARTTGGFDHSAGTITLHSLTSFTAGTGGSGTASFLGAGTASSGAGNLIASGTLTPNVVTGSGITPQCTTATSWALD